MSTTSLARLLSVQETADILGCSVSYLQHQTSRHEIPFTKVGRLVRFTEDQVREIIAAGEQRPTKPLLQKSRGSARSKL